jgi:hypothetical protein
MFVIAELQIVTISEQACVMAFDILSCSGWFVVNMKPEAKYLFRAVAILFF